MVKLSPTQASALQALNDGPILRPVGGGKSWVPRNKLDIRVFSQPTVMSLKRLGLLYFKSTSLKDSRGSYDRMARITELGVIAIVDMETGLNRKYRVV